MGKTAEDYINALVWMLFAIACAADGSLWRAGVCIGLATFILKFGSPFKVRKSRP